jgi:translation initiation factor 1
VHIRVQQRNGRKRLTTIQGLGEVPGVPEKYEIDARKVLKFMRKMFCTNGTILKDDNDNDVIQLQGDKRKLAYDFLVTHNVCRKEDITLHNF